MAMLSLAGQSLLDRRGFLGSMGGGLAGIALFDLLRHQGYAETPKPIRPSIDPQHPHASRVPHFAPKAKRVLHIFCSGACSQLDTWDYKPELIKRHGQAMPNTEKLVTFQGENGSLQRSPYEFKQRGQCGKFTSSLLPQLGELVDEMCFIHSLTSKTNTHGPGESFANTGFTLEGFPSAGAWITYALGTENQNLPAFVAIPDPRGIPQIGPANWSAGFLPGVFQGTPFNAATPIPHLTPAKSLSRGEDEAARELLKTLNEAHLQQRQHDTSLRARIASYELAARLQLTAPEVANLDQESAATRTSYGLDSPNKFLAGFGRNCLLARRLLERGVRYVQLFNGAYAMGEGVGNWDGHKQLKKDYDRHGPILDQPAAALLTDMKARGLLKDTLVIWSTEFGRMPTFQKGAQGRDHNPHGFTAWLAGAGVKKGFSYGATDDFGHKAIEKVTSIYDFYATILHLLGLDHQRLSYYHNGIERRLTDVHGHVIRDVLS
jgi:hypothetical protein